MRAIVVSVNGVYQQLNEDFVTKGHMIVFKQPPSGIIDISAHTDNKRNMTSYTGRGIQTTFHLPAFPSSKFAAITDHSESVPKGYTVVDVNAEIDLWIRENCPISDWKWADQLNDAEFGMTRLIVRESIVTYIATRWAE